MNPPKGKFLVDLFAHLSHKQILFLFWGALVGLFVYLMISHYQKMTRSHFKRDPYHPPKNRPPSSPAVGGPTDKAIVRVDPKSN